MDLAALTLKFVQWLFRVYFLCKFSLAWIQQNLREFSVAYFLCWNWRFWTLREKKRYPDDTLNEVSITLENDFNYRALWQLLTLLQEELKLSSCQNPCWNWNWFSCEISNVSPPNIIKDYYYQSCLSVPFSCMILYFLACKNSWKKILNLMLGHTPIDAIVYCCKFLGMAKKVFRLKFGIWQLQSLS